MNREFAEARRELEEARGIVVLTGAGISAASGIPTFRDAGGLWDGAAVEELATPDGFLADPVRVWRWYSARRDAVRAAAPNAAHLAVAEFQLRREDVTVVTQNVDGLHDHALEEVLQAAPHPSSAPVPQRVLSLHGSLLRTRCHRCSAFDDEAQGPTHGTDAERLPRCRRCSGLLRPAVVWFGESLPEEELDAAFQAASEADLCLSVGTSALVHPAASLPLQTLDAGGRVWEVNPEETSLTPLAHRRFRGAADLVLPVLLGDAGRP